MAAKLIVNHKHKWAAVAIPRVGCTTLKRLIIADHFPDVKIEREHVVHDWFESNAINHHAPSDSTPAGYRRFAVWRDPVSRTLSLWIRFCILEKRYEPFGSAGLFGCNLRKFVEWISEKLRRNGVHVDFHFRRQIDFYSPADVDDIVPIEHLTAYLKELGHEEVPRSYATPEDNKAEWNLARVAEIVRLYAEDYQIPYWGKMWRPGKPMATIVERLGGSQSSQGSQGGDRAAQSLAKAPPEKPDAWRRGKHVIRGWFNDAQQEIYREEARKINGGLIVEIGVDEGLSLISIAEICKKTGTKLVGIDPWGRQKEPIPHAVLSEVIGKLKLGATVELRRERSPDAAAGFSDESVDLVFIDGDHSYRAVLADISAWWLKLKPGGLIMGHDANFPSVLSAVKKFAREIGVNVACRRKMWFLDRKPV